MHLEVDVPGHLIDSIKPDPTRGYRVGVAEVKKVLRGGRAPRQAPVYLPAATSCSYFGRGEPRAVSADGYLVGAFTRDAGGLYFAAAEEHQGARPPDAPTPF